jgi:6-pyruvoyl-tetrahydropterin synthase related domain
MHRITHGTSASTQTAWSARSTTTSIIVAYAVAATLPALWNGFVFGHDTLSHLVMSRHFVDQLWAGNWYPRWLENMNAGLGSQVFHFYGPVPYYVTSLFHPFVVADSEGWHQLGLAASLSVAASGYACYLWLRPFSNETAALIGAVIYMSAPYHLAIDLYQRFAFAELWSFVWMPLILMQTRRITAEAKQGTLALALPSALLVMTHLPTTLLFSPIPAAYALWMARDGQRLNACLRVVGAMTLGAGLSAIYLLPAMATQDHINIDDLRTGHFHFANHFLYAGDYPNEVVRTISEGVGQLTALTLVAACASWLLRMKQSDKNGVRESAFWMATAVIAFLMMLPPSKPVWEAVPLLQSVQFPWRLNLVLTIAATALIAECLATYDRSAPGWRWVLFAIPCSLMVLTSVLAVAVELALARELGAPSLDKLSRSFAESHPELTLRLEATKLSRYDYFLPKWIAPELFALSPAAVQALESLGRNPRRGAIVEGSGVFNVTKWQPGNIAVDVESPTGVTLVLNQFYYPGWTARTDGNGIALPLEPSKPEGLISIALPGGTHQLQVTLETTPIERAGQVVSLISLCIAAMLAVRRALGKRSAMQKPQVA